MGFLVGWLVEWYLDNQSRAQREGQLAVGSDGTVNEHVSELTQTLKEVLSEREDEVEGLRVLLEKQESHFNQLRDDFDRYSETHPDDLTVIKGIGRIYQWKLRDAGYSTYAQLAQANTQHLRDVLDIEPWQKTDPQSWIKQAQVLTHRD